MEGQFEQFTARISDEIIPETHTKGHERVATLGTILGVIVMLYLDVSLA